MADWKAGMVDLELDDEDQLDYMRPLPMKAPDYPCGLKICLTHSELAKLKLAHDCDVGDQLEFRAIAKVTNVTKGEDSCRVELQICQMDCNED